MTASTTYQQDAGRPVAAVPLFEEYVSALREYIAAPEPSQEDGRLARARELGREALSRGWHIPQVSALHHQAVLACADHLTSVGDPAEGLALATEFLEEAVSPFRMARGRYGGPVFVSALTADASRQADHA